MIGDDRPLAYEKGTFLPLMKIGPRNTNEFPPEHPYR